MNFDPTHSTVTTPIEPRAQASVFRWLRWRLLSNAFHQALTTAKLRLITVIASCLVIWVFAFVVSWWGFGFLVEKQIPATGLIVGALFDLMFFALGAMLVFSTGIIMYASLFTAPESRFLLTTPAFPDRIFASKFQTAVSFSSWAFIVLGSPVLIGYGIVFAVPWYFYAALPVFLLGFVILPGAVGAMLAVLLVNYIPRRRKQFFVVFMLLLTAVIIFWVYRTVLLARETAGNRDALESLIGQFALARSAFSPSHWMSRGLVTVARGDFVGSLYPLALIWSNALFAYVIAAWLAKRLYRRGFNRIASHGGGRVRRRVTWPDRVMEWLVFYLDRPTRLLIVKDFRTFRRDPAQWVQIAIFAGLMLLYSFNSRRFYQNDVGSQFSTVISLLNIGAISFLMCAFLLRFVYPMLSLEGRKFWILGLLPIRREQLLWGKFVFAFTGSIVVGSLLVVISDLLLAMPPLGIGLHLLTIILVGLGLSGLAVGFGAWMPNFRETDPSKIAVGFGGTMTTVVSLFYMMLVIGLVAGPYHGVLLGRLFSGALGVPWWTFAGIPVGLACTVLAVVIPMRLGARTLRRVEF